MPDFDAWEGCFTELTLGDCGNAALDLPAGKALKFYKNLKKSRDGASGGAKKADECHSFVPGTRVLMADGTTKAIEEIEIGDRVVATDPETGETAAKEVTAELTSTGTKDLVTLTVTTADGASAPITATDGHPFWAPSSDTWTHAGDLQPGTWLQISSGTYVLITAVNHKSTTTTVHNLTVAGFHTYYVLAGETPVVVHNCNGRDPVHGGLDDDTYNRIDRTHGPDVADGVDYQVQRMHDGSPTAAAHDLPGIGHDPDALASYFASWRGKMTHVDTRTGSSVAYDSERGVLIVTTSRNIHGYRYSQAAFESGRYVTP